MSNPPEPGGPRNGSSGRGLPMVRAGIVLVAFVVATVLLLGVIHPSAVTPVSNSAPPSTTPGQATGSTTSTSTTTPTHSGNSATTVPPSKVSVLVANASAVTGAAAAVAAELQPAGWNLEAPVNASAKVVNSSIYYLAGQQQSALAIALALRVPNTAVGPYTTAAPISSIGSAEVLVVVGPDLATRSTSSTTTTAAATATTARPSTTSSTHH
jgi:hypothetical protein